MSSATLFTIAKVWKKIAYWRMNESRKCGIYTMKYYSVTKKKKISSFATTWMNLEGCMLSEINQIKTNTVWNCLYVNLKKKGQIQRSSE